MVSFIPLELSERNRLTDLLKMNANENGGIRIRRDTSFDSYISNEEIEDEEVVIAIKSVPCHY